VKVKKIIIMNSDNHILFKGSLLMLPYKRDAIIQKSIELFNDHDPCIIHESYSIHQLSEMLIALFEQEGTLELPIHQLVEKAPFIHWDDFKNAVFRLEVK
jgi:hypothetical protein